MMPHAPTKGNVYYRYWNLLLYLQQAALRYITACMTQPSLGGGTALLLCAALGVFLRGVCLCGVCLRGALGLEARGLFLLEGLQSSALVAVYLGEPRLVLVLVPLQLCALPLDAEVAVHLDARPARRRALPRARDALLFALLVQATALGAEPLLIDLGLKFTQSL